MNKKRLLKITLVLLTLIFVCFSSVFAADQSISITSKTLKTGKEITTSLNGLDEADIEYRWLVAGEDVHNNASSYKPTASDYESWIQVEAIDKASGTILASDKVYFSNLPVVYISTNNNEEITSKSEYIDATMSIQGNYQFDSLKECDIEIKGRGTSSWQYDKKPYKIKLDKKADLFGFGKSKHYVLLANYLDPSLLRNTLAYELSSQLGITATDSTWVDLILNGEYIGNYQLAEHIRIGKNLIDITDWEDKADDVADEIAENYSLSKSDKSLLKDALKEDLSWITTGSVIFQGQTYPTPTFSKEELSGGFLYELDTDYTDEITHFETNGGIKVAVSKPEYLVTNDGMFTFAKEYLQSVEDAVKSIDGYNAQGKHYSELVDFDSMLAYWLSMELMSNDDAASRSRYCYKPSGQPLYFGPVWDFDIASSSMRSFIGPIGWNPTGSIAGWFTGQDFFKEFVDDPYFQVKAQEKYWENHEYLESIIADGGIIDTYSELLYESGATNELLWTNDRLIPRSFTGCLGDVNILKAFLKTRLAWLDDVFKTEESTTLSMAVMLSLHPYIKNELICMSILNGYKDLSEHGADYLIDENTNPVVKIVMPTNKTAKLYVNGILLGEYSKAELKNGIEIPHEKLTEETGKKNVISVIGAKNQSLSRNYISVRVNASKQTNNGTVNNDICGHNNVDFIPYRKATSARYGIKECYYCNDCHHYFADEICTKPLDASDVIVSVNTSYHPGGILTKLNRLLRHTTDIWPF